MYQAYYKLSGNPFRLSPDPAFLYMSLQHREALAGLVSSVNNRPGLTILTGEAGTGKTLLLRVLMEWLGKYKFHAALCNNPTMTREELFDFLMVQLGVNCSSSLKSRQLLAIYETLSRYRDEGSRAILIVDEAHQLPIALLEEIRLLLNIETAHEKLIEIVLAGQPELSELLRRPELRQLKQRAGCVCKLQPFNLDEVHEYVDHRLRVSGLAEQRLFGREAISIIHRYTGGIPRLINIVCENALQTSFALRLQQVSPPILQEVALDLDLLDGTAQDERTPVFSGVLPGKEPPLEPRASQPQVKVGIPLESYASRQKSVGFLSDLMARWK